MAYSDQQVLDYIRGQGLVGNGQVNAPGIYSAAQQFGVDASQLDRVGSSQGWWGNTGATDWVTSKGLGGALGTQAPAAGGNPYLQVSGTPTPVANTPQQYPGAGASTGGPIAGNATGTMTPGPTLPMPGAPGDIWNDPRWGSRGGNPYMPAGGQGSNYGNDPRMGMPSTGNQGFGGLGDYLWQNPSTMAMGNELTRQSNNNLFRNVLPQIRGNAMASGTVGGSRQGVAEGLGIGEAMAALAGAQANLYGNQFNQDRGYGLQSDALDFGIHRGNLQDMRQGQMDQVNFLNQMTQWGQQGVGMANQTRDRPFTDWNRFVQPASQMAGLGGQTTQQLSGNPYAAVLGGWAAGQKMYGG